VQERKGGEEGKTELLQEKRDVLSGGIRRVEKKRAQERGEGGKGRGRGTKTGGKHYIVRRTIDE
jgi:hypothetical protein